MMTLLTVASVLITGLACFFAIVTVEDKMATKTQRKAFLAAVLWVTLTWLIATI